MFVVAAKRTAFGTYGGKLKNVSATELGLQASKGALESANISPELINSVIFGNVMAVRGLTCCGMVVEEGETPLPKSRDQKYI